MAQRAAEVGALCLYTGQASPVSKGGPAAKRIAATGTERTNSCATVARL
jgi:hypothetical protein